jgi:ElaB/YqjD/DUF883 family membrane-anchored ribosome-binding protein
MTFEDAANSAMRQTMDQGRQAADKAGQVLKDSYGAAREYVHDKGLAFDPGEFARREPWLAIAAAFAIGYFAARLIRRVS